MDFSGLAALLTSTRQSHAWDDRGFYLDLVRDFIGPHDRNIFEAWARNQPNDAGVVLACGVHAIAWAWEARGSGVGSTVSEEASRVFTERLHVAEAELNRAIAMDPADPTPHAFLILCAQGLNRDKQEALTHFSAAMAKDPENMLACQMLLTFLHPKWHGSAAEVRSMALDIARRVPPGSDLRALPFIAHAYAWEYVAMFENNRQQADAALLAPDARAELEEAFASWAGSQSRSGRRSSIILRNFAAFWLYLLGDRARLAMQLDAIGTAHRDVPWAYVGTTGDSFESRAKSGIAEARALAARAA